MTAKQKYDKILDQFLPGLIIEALVVVYGIAIDKIWLIVAAVLLETILLFFFFKRTRSLKDDGDHVADCQRYISR